MKTDTGIGFVTSTQAAKLLGISPDTLRIWDMGKALVPDLITIGGHRRYKLSTLENFRNGMKQANLAPLTFLSEQMAADLVQIKQIVDKWFTKEEIQK